jgi:2'-5' RNA ligase
VRTFIALDLDPEVKRAISDFQRKLRRLGPPSVSWTKEGGMHLTLKFLGEIDDPRAAECREKLAQVAGSTAAFSVSVRGTGTFPPGRRPRVLWVGIPPTPDLARLQARVEDAAEELGFPREERPFHPHLTLGRVRSPGGLESVQAELEAARERDFGLVTVRTLVFYQSVLRPAGAEYSPLGVFTFS